MKRNRRTLEEESFQRVSKEIREAIGRIREKMPEAADYLEAHLEFDPVNCTVRYTGDDRLQLIRQPPQKP